MNPTEEARKLLEEVGFDLLPIIPQDICKQLQIAYAELPFEGFEGTIQLDSSGQIFIGVNEKIKEHGRKNFTCAHELGHSCMDLFDNSSIVCSKSEVESFSDKIRTIELRANRFAAELLFPRHLLPSDIVHSDPEWSSVERLAQACNTSLLASAHRFVEMTDHSCVLIVSENRKISYYRRSKAFGVFPDMDSRALAKQSYAYNAFEGKAQEDFEVVAADIWLPLSKRARDAELLEWSLPMNSYGQVLTILWDDSGISAQSSDTDREDERDTDDDVSTEWEPPTFHRSKRRP